MTIKNVFYAQSGGVTAVINATAASVIETCRQHPDRFGKVLVGKNGILGALREELIDTSHYTDDMIQALKQTPGGAFGSCRFKLKGADAEAQYQRLIEVFQAHNIGTFFYNGGNDSQDTAQKVAEMSERMDFPIQCIGIPKTIDNDLPITDCCPGFGSVAKYAAVAIREAGLDVAAMASSSTKVFILEVMGRHAGWIAAGSGLAQTQPGQAPHIILFPEIPFEKQVFDAEVKRCIDEHGFCAIVVSEGIKTADGNMVAASSGRDAFGHAQLGGVAAVLANHVQGDLGFKVHYAIADYLQRSARHLASQVDLEQAIAVGKKAVEFAIEGKTSVLPIIVRDNHSPYQWHVEAAPISAVANQEKMMPRDFITTNGFHITEKAREYLSPLIQGEAYPSYSNGLPDYCHLKHQMVTKKCAAFAE